VDIANTSLLNTDWYVRQIIRNPIRPYDAAKGPSIYRGRNWAMPKGPPIKMTLDQADSIPIAIEVPDTQVFQAGKIIARIAPRILTKADIAVLRMIKDNDDRPVYFSRTSGGYGQELGLGPYLITQGLARRVVADIPTPGRDTLLVPGEGFLDLNRTRALWDSVFTGPEAMVKRGGWPDKPSIGIPALYIQTGFLLSDVLHNLGDSSSARKALERARAVAKGTRVDDLFDFNTLPAAPTGVSGDAQPKLAVPLKDSGAKKE
jgi:hypothetical protein